jgi:hypothetical protein
VPLLLPQLPHGLMQTWTWASTLRGRLLTAWAMAWPFVTLLLNVKPQSGQHKLILATGIINVHVFYWLYFFLNYFHTVTFWCSIMCMRWQNGVSFLKLLYTCVYSFIWISEFQQPSFQLSRMCDYWWSKVTFTQFWLEKFNVEEIKPAIIVYKWILEL